MQFHLHWKGRQLNGFADKPRRNCWVDFATPMCPVICQTTLANISLLEKLA
jgi:hypothetical protein